MLRGCRGGAVNNHPNHPPKKKKNAKNMYYRWKSARPPAGKGERGAGGSSRVAEELGARSALPGGAEVRVLKAASPAMSGMSESREFVGMGERQ